MSILGKKRATIKDVAEKASVSISIVSYVLNDTPGKSIPESTRQRVIKAAKKLDYLPNIIARGMRTKRSMAIGVVSFWDVTQPVFNQFLKGIAKVTDEHSYTIVLNDLHSKPKEFDYIKYYRRRQIDGIIFISPPEGITGFEEKEHIKKIKKYNIPAVILNGYTANDDINYIYINYYQSTYLATEYLIKHGHDKIGYLLPKKDELDHIQGKERLNGYYDALKDNDIEIKEENVFFKKDIEEIINKVERENVITALVANKAHYAYPFMKSALEQQVTIPDTISIISANDTPFTRYLYPSLTAVQLPLHDMGENGAELLFESIEGKAPYSKLKLPNKIVERDSVLNINEQ